MNSRWDQLGIPTPGSRQALDQGCMCAVLDNQRGHGFALEHERAFWITAECPLHDPVDAVLP